MVWFMLNKITAIALIFFLLIPLTVLAEPPVVPELPPQPRVMGIQQGEAAPYSGVLLNSIAAAKVFTERDFSQTQCDLRIKFEVAKELARVNLILETTRVSMESMEQRYTSLLQIKNTEIERLSKIASDTNDYSAWWATGGVIVGIALTIGVMYAVQPGLQ